MPGFSVQKSAHWLARTTSPACRSNRSARALGVTSPVPPSTLWRARRGNSVTLARPPFPSRRRLRPLGPHPYQKSRFTPFTEATADRASMGQSATASRFPLEYLLADSRDGQIKEAEVTRTAPSSQPTHGNIRHGFAAAGARPPRVKGRCVPQGETGSHGGSPTIRPNPQCRPAPMVSGPATGCADVRRRCTFARILRLGAPLDAVACAVAGAAKTAIRLRHLQPQGRFRAGFFFTAGGLVSGR